MARKIDRTSRLLKEMVAAARQLKVDLLSRRQVPALVAARESLSADLKRELSVDETADVLAQAVVCAAPIIAKTEFQAAVDWLYESLSGWEQWVLTFVLSRAARAEYSVLSTQYAVSSTGHAEPNAWEGSEPPHVYDQFLHRYAPQARRHHGVFFTPQPIADFIVRTIDETLRNDFGLSEGLASQSTIRTPHSAIRNPQSAIRFLDPACGTGVFLLAVIDHLHARMGDDWNSFVPDLLPRLTGIELLPVPALIAKLNIAQKLAATGYDFRHGGRICIHLGDALNPDLHFAIRNPQSAIPVILGNPPFSSLSTNTNPWIARLVRGDDEVRGYVQAGDVRLGERKTWLHDDYVKFIRLAQWQVEQAGRGIVAFVTNHGYLDNATFRLMRQELLRVFPRIEIVDLHGNRKKRETAPDGGGDENVFGLDQGVAIGLFAKPTGRASEGEVTRRACEVEVQSDGASRVAYAELWGTREEKLGTLGAASSLGHQACLLSPQSPQWSMVPRSDVFHPEYAAAWPLHKAMPVNTTAPVTARDHFVVGFTTDELHRRIAEFRDLAISDDEIRTRYFSRTRSRRYPPGDTRSWKLAEARRIVAADEGWHDHIIRCLYRPFDWRYVFWHPAMIDWPRSEVVRHMMPERDLGSKFKVQSSKFSSTLNFEPGTLNLCLIARRQQLPTQPCTYFFVSDCVALDGVIRSDNRGSESLFPLYLEADDGGANFEAAFLAEVAGQIGSSPPPDSLFAYLYALFHSPTYRERYAHELRTDFPRILLPKCDEIFQAMAAAGQRLIELHLLRGSGGALRLWRPVSAHVGQVAPAKDSRPPGASTAIDFRVGGYAVPKKWLQPGHRGADEPQFARIAAAIDHSIALMAAIDALIAQHGGFPAAFQSKPRPVVGVLGEWTTA